MGVKLKIEGIDLFEDGSMLVNVTLAPNASSPMSDPVTMKFNLSDNTIGSETLAEGDLPTTVLAKTLVRRVEHIVAQEIARA